MAKDPARKETDDKLEDLERRITQEYDTAQKELWGKANKYFDRFSARDAKKLEEVKAGTLSQGDYIKWREGAMMYGKRYDEMINELTWTAVNADIVAMSMVADSMPETFAINANYGAYEVYRSTGVNTAFTLYNKDAVVKLLKDNPRMLPEPSVNIPKDMRWNRQHINSALVQGILQGDSMNNIAKRLRSVTDMDKSAAIRNARTMTTAAENVGKMHSYRRATSMGVEGKKMWVATHDGRTRESHARLDGEVCELDEPFGNDLMEPGDPDGDPEEVYNCRCTMVYVSKYSTFSGDYETYDQWQKRTEYFGASVDGYSWKEVSKMSELLDSTDPKTKELWLKAKEFFRAPHDAPLSESRYDYPSNTVYVPIRESVTGNEYANTFEMFFHEYAHNIDYVTHNGNWLSLNYKNEYGMDLAQMLEYECDRIITGYAGDVADKTESIRIFCNEIINKYPDRERANLSQLFERYTSMHAGIDAPFGYGHDNPTNSNNACIEGFASMFASEVSNKESLELIKGYLPESYAFYRKIIMFGVGG